MIRVSKCLFNTRYNFLFFPSVANFMKAETCAIVAGHLKISFLQILNCPSIFLMK